jgi:hypothetical protein
MIAELPEYSAVKETAIEKNKIMQELFLEEERAQTHEEKCEINKRIKEIFKAVTPTESYILTELEGK